MTAEPPATGRAADEPELPAISEEEWARFVEESAGPARARAPREPSARARMVTERLRREGEAAARHRGTLRRWRRRGRPAAPRQPEGWRTAPARPQARGQRWSGVVAGLVFVVLLVVVVADPARVLS
ncbi:hypothetical protein [Streptomyces xinghaiensis]|uniref:hypothetical protein n=1 Tax=Streptomyces xinghaiensis TaxID=1038928 RepID=UPI000BAF10E8|nr:hypothetical protein [Streptomyces xinghaiensis]